MEIKLTELFKVEENEWFRINGYIYKVSNNQLYIYDIMCADRWCFIDYKIVRNIRECKYRYINDVCSDDTAMRMLKFFKALGYNYMSVIRESERWCRDIKFYKDINAKKRLSEENHFSVARDILNRHFEINICEFFLTFIENDEIYYIDDLIEFKEKFGILVDLRDKV